MSLAVEAQDIFDKAMSIMDELNQSGSSTTTDTQEYVYRTPGILNMLCAECRVLSGETGRWVQMEGLEDSITGLGDNLVIAAFPYGLAANLLIDENPTAASFFQQRYEEIRERAIARTPGTFEAIEDVYGGGSSFVDPYNEFSMWG